FVSLERGNVESWGKYSRGIWATGDNKGLTPTPLFSAKDVNIVTHGDNASGFETAFVQSRFEDGSIYPYGYGSHAVAAGNGGAANWPGSRVTVIGSRLSTEGESAYGVVTTGGSRIDAAGVQISTKGEYAAGAVTIGSARVTISNGSSIVTEGLGAHGAIVQRGSQIDIDGSSILTTGEAGAGLFLIGYNTPANVTPTTKDVNVANVTNSTIETRQAAALRIRGSYSNTFNLTGSRI